MKSKNFNSKYNFGNSDNIDKFCHPYNVLCKGYILHLFQIGIVIIEEF